MRSKPCSNLFRHKVFKKLLRRDDSSGDPCLYNAHLRKIKQLLSIGDIVEEMVVSNGAHADEPLIEKGQIAEADYMQMLRVTCDLGSSLKSGPAFKIPTG